MEALKKTYHQTLKIYDSLTGSQRLSLLVVLALIGGTLGYLVFNRSSAAYVPASLGKNFSGEEMQNALAVLREKGLTDYKQNGGQLLVPRSQVDRYNAALLEGGGLPTDWASELEHQFEKQGWFPSDKQSQLRKEIALGKELRRILRAIPDIADARVVWARTEAKRFSGRTGKVTATVNIKPRGGRDLPPRLVRSLQQAVASMISGLKPEDVTIFNLQTGESYTVQKESPFDGRLIEWIKQHTRMYKEKVEQQLSFIPGALVTVDVKVENLESWVEESRQYNQKSSVTTSERNKTRTDENTEDAARTEPGEAANVPRSLATRRGGAKRRKSSETDQTTTTVPGYTATLKKYIAAMPKAVQVSVGIPEEYFEKVLARKNDGSGQATPPTREQILTDIKHLVAHTVGADPNSNAVEVRPYVKVAPPSPDLETPWTETVFSFLNQWGGPLGLGLFALLALWMVRKNMPEMPEPDTEPIPAAAPRPPENSGTTSQPQSPSSSVTPPQSTPRDELQSIVRDNPEMTASVISEWLRAAN